MVSGLRSLVFSLQTPARAIHHVWLDWRWSKSVCVYFVIIGNLQSDGDPEAAQPRRPLSGAISVPVCGTPTDNDLPIDVSNAPKVAHSVGRVAKQAGTGTQIAGGPVDPLHKEGGVRNAHFVSHSYESWTLPGPSESALLYGQGKRIDSLEILEYYLKAFGGGVAS